jgi:ribosomal protein S27E
MEPKNGLNKQTFGLVYGNFAQTVGCAQCGSTLFAIFGFIVFATSIIVNSFVKFKIVN